jgi:hypothetical protein
MQLGKFTITPPNVFGSIEMRHEQIRYGGPNSIGGWAIADNNAQIEKVRILLNSAVIGEGPAGIERADIKKRYPNFKYSSTSGYKIDFDASIDMSTVYELEILDKDNNVLITKNFRLSEFVNSPFMGL